MRDYFTVAYAFNAAIYLEWPTFTWWQKLFYAPVFVLLLPRARSSACSWSALLNKQRLLGRL
jgi:hypothetical protein